MISILHQQSMSQTTAVVRHNKGATGVDSCARLGIVAGLEAICVLLQSNCPSRAMAENRVSRDGLKVKLGYKKKLKISHYSQILKHISCLVVDQELITGKVTHQSPSPELNTRKVVVSDSLQGGSIHHSQMDFFCYSCGAFLQEEIRLLAEMLVFMSEAAVFCLWESLGWIQNRGASVTLDKELNSVRGVL